MHLREGTLRTSRWLALSWAAVLAVGAATAAQPLQLGVFPYLPTATLLATYEPLRQHLASQLRRPIEASTAPNFREFAKRCLAGEYDLLVLGSGVGRYMEREAGYVPLVVSRRDVRALLLVRTVSGIAQIADLRDARIATLDQFTASSQLGRHLLRKGGIDPDRQVRLDIVATPFNAVQAVILGESEGAIVPSALLTQLPAEMRGKLRILAESAAIPGITVYARLGAALPPAPSLTALLLEFTDNSEAGRNFARQAMLDGFRTVAADELKASDAFLPEIRRQLSR